MKNFLKVLLRPYKLYLVSGEGSSYMTGIVNEDWLNPLDRRVWNSCIAS